MGDRSKTRFGRITQALHWLTAIFVLVAFIYGLGGPESRVYAPSRDLDRQLHETLGMCVLALTVLRMLWKMVDTPPQAIALPRWMTIAAKSTQGVLYLLLFAVPMTAIAGAWLEGHPLTLLAGIEVPPLLGLSHDLGKSISELHTILGDAILWIAGIHAAAAIYHHWVLKDAVLASMLPEGFPTGRSKAD